MSDLDAVANGMATLLATTGANVYDVWPDLVNPPAIIVDGPSAMTEVALGCNDVQASYDVIVIVSMGAGLAAAQRQLRPYLSRRGTQSVYVALEADKTFGGAAQTMMVREERAMGEIEANDSPLFGAILGVDVIL